MKSEPPVVVGVDIGGTKVAAGLADCEGNIVVRSRTPMLTTGSASKGLDAVSTAISGLFTGAASRNQIAAIGICAPEPFDLRTGVIITPQSPDLA